MKEPHKLPPIEIYGLLATGSNDQMTAFHFSVCHRLNSIQTRGQTTHYTCIDSDLPAVIAHAKRLKVTLQKIISNPGIEEYELLVQGDLPKWEPDYSEPEV